MGAVVEQYERESQVSDGQAEGIRRGDIINVGTVDADKPTDACRADDRVGHVDQRVPADRAIRDDQRLVVAGLEIEAAAEVHDIRNDQARPRHGERELGRLAAEHICRVEYQVA